MTTGTYFTTDLEGERGEREGGGREGGRQTDRQTDRDRGQIEQTADGGHTPGTATSEKL